MNGGGFAGRNLPALRKPAKMIETDVVEIVREPAHAVDPPRISLLPHHVPAIKRIAPALAVLAEKIRRHAGDDLGIEYGVQAKQIRMGPDIGAVEIHKDGDVAHDANGMLRAVGTKRLPLLEEKELHGAADLEIVEHFRVRLLDCHWIAMRQFTRPAVPAFQVETGAQSIEQHKVIEPPLVLPAEVLIARACTRWSRAHKVVRRFKYQGQFVAEDRQVIDGLDCAGQGVNLGAVNPAAIGKALQADQQRISGKSRSGRIGRGSVPERAERQHLPQTLARGGKKIREGVCRRTKVADPAARSERGGMKQNSAGARERHQNQFSAISYQLSGRLFTAGSLGAENRELRVF